MQRISLLFDILTLVGHHRKAHIPAFHKPECKRLEFPLEGHHQASKIDLLVWVATNGQYQIVSKTYMTRVESENTRLRHYLARLHRQTLCYSKSEEMLRYAIRLLLHYLKFWDVPVPT